MEKHDVAAKTEKPKLMDVLKSVGEDDLAEVDARIEELQTELDALLVVRKVLDVKLHGKPVRKQRGSGGGNTAKGEAILRGKKKAAVIRYLEVAGPKKPAIIAADTGLDANEVLEILKGDAFKEYPNGQFGLRT